MALNKYANSAKRQWQKGSTTIYENNYGYGMNFYQPMIEYLDDKKIKGRVEYPHLPYANERGLEQYSPRKLVRSYTELDLQKLRNDARENAKQGLEHLRPPGSSGYSLQKTFSAAAFQKVHVEVKKIKKKKSKKTTSTVPDFDYDPDADKQAELALKKIKKYIRRKSANSIEQLLLKESRANINENAIKEIQSMQSEQTGRRHDSRAHMKMMNTRMTEQLNDSFMQPLDSLNRELRGFDKKTTINLQSQSKQTSIEIEQLSARVVEAETKLRTEVTRIKKKLQIHITELEMSLDVANKTNIDLQKTIKKQSITLTELQAHYDEVQRQFQVTIDQLSIAQRKVQSLTAECEEIRGNYESALRGKRAAEVQFEESVSRINELTTINVNIASAKSKIEQELTVLAGDYDEVTRELRVSDERYQRVQTELKHTVEILHEEQERIVKIEAIKKSLEIEVKNLSIRLEEVEANAIVGGKRIISKLEARMRDLELELDEEKRRHAETIKILRKKERQVKEVMIQCEEDQKNISLLQESLDKTGQKVSIYKRQLQEQEGMSQQSVTRVRRFQRELEAAEDRADCAESNLSLIRAKHRTFVTTSSVPGSQVYLVQETRTSSSETM